MYIVTIVYLGQQDRLVICIDDANGPARLTTDEERVLVD